MRSVDQTFRAGESLPAADDAARRAIRHLDVRASPGRRCGEGRDPEVRPSSGSPRW